MSVRYSPLKTSSVTSKTSLTSRLIHLTQLDKEDQSLLSNIDDETKPGEIENSDLLDPTPEEVQDAGIVHKFAKLGENTNYAPDRAYHITPAGNNSADDITEPLHDLQQDAENAPIVNPQEPTDNDPMLDNKDKPVVPPDVVNYNEAAIKGSDTMNMVIDALGIQTDKALSKQEIIDDHIAYNAQFFNAVYYSQDYAKSIVKLGNLDFLNYFYPNMITHNFYQRIQTVLGGLIKDKDIYKILKMRVPVVSSVQEDIGGKDLADKDMEALRDYIQFHYNTMDNWFQIDVSDDIDHIVYCLRMYSILDWIMRDEYFDPSRFGEKHLELIGQWESRIFDLYDQLEKYKEYSPDWYRTIQKLHDLCWNFLDNPRSDDVKAECIIAITGAMAGGSDTTATDPSLVTKSDCNKYLVQQLGYDDSIYLIPDKLEYPIINRYSVKLAMDMINQVKKEFPEDINTFIKNINRKYKELGCTFSITPDHPFAPYADDNIIDHITFILIEGDTAVDDSDGASEIGSPNNKTDQPWYKRLDYTGTLYRDGSENKEMGPNTKPMQKPDWTQHYSIL